LPDFRKKKRKDYKEKKKRDRELLPLLLKLKD
jgi:hypothetical protein